MPACPSGLRDPIALPDVRFPTTRPRARPMRQQRDLGELHGTRERRPGAAPHTSEKDPFYRPWESPSALSFWGGVGNVQRSTSASCTPALEALTK
eukprot:scaffold63118_cov89-Phaeocystis_antarctica.AAC.1